MNQKPNLKIIDKLLEQILQLLNEANIPYLVYGSYALTHYIKSNAISVNDIDIIVSKSSFDHIEELFERNRLPFKLFVSDHEIHANHNSIIGNDAKPFDISFDSYEHYFAKYDINIDKYTKKHLSSGIVIHLAKKEDLLSIYNIGANDEFNPKKEQYKEKLERLLDVKK
jgi:hypothetical protein